MKKIFYILTTLLLFLTLSCTSATPTLTKEQYREYTTRVINSDYKTVFKSVLSVLQDQKYIIQNSDFNNGLINAERESKLNDSLVDVIEKRRSNMKASFLLSEKEPKKTNVRVTLQESKKGYYTNFSYNVIDVVNIQKKEVYDNIFNEINKEIEMNK
ncbi:hypothetical protein [uncultured Sneathia sp.]|uniref:hypothetical protein n=1 Tax=uncultured Sneathia sp. TaxID=278067 RepID=UPI002594E1A4|nr:hypothetical protein [uncultured Sneathia sp.]